MKNAHGERWRTQISAVTPRVLTDPAWAVVGRRLDLAAATTDNLPGLLDQALTAGPLPDDHPASALWYRLVAHLTPETLAGRGSTTRLRPTYTDTLLQALPAGVGTRVLRDRHWPELVAALNTAQASGVDPAQAITDAVTAIRPERIGHPDGVAAEDLAVVLTWRVSELTTPPAEAGQELSERDLYDPLRDTIPFPTTAPSAEPLVPTPEGLVEPAEDLDVPPEAEDLPPADLAALSAADVDQAAAALRVAGGSVRARIVELHEQAAAFYREQYLGSPAARYVASRFSGTDLSSDPRVTIGYAPSGPRALVDHLTRAGATPAELVEAGLAKYTREGRVIDVFRERVVIGIRDTEAALVGFSGRAAPGAPAEVPKYVNTPTTAAFVKGAVLFGYAEHHQALSAGAVPVRTEGWFDAIAITKAGRGAAVGLAPLGTALTDAQADLLAQATATHHQPVLIATDRDKAGRAAAARDYWTLSRHGLDTRRLVLIDPAHPEVVIHDPAEAYQRDRGTGLHRLLAAVDVAPSLVGEVVANTLHAQAPQIGGHVGAAIAAAREAGRIIAAAPLEQWDDTIDQAAGLLAHLTHRDDQDWYRELVTDATIHAAADWDPLTTAEPPEQLRRRLEGLTSRLGTRPPSNADAAQVDGRGSLSRRVDELRNRAREHSTLTSEDLLNPSVSSGGRVRTSFIDHDPTPTSPSQRSEQHQDRDRGLDR